MSCPAPELLAALQAGALPTEQAKALETHARGCAECQKRLAAAAPDATVREAPTAATVGNKQRRRSRAVRQTTLGPGSVFGRYVVLSELGKGGMGAVYAAYDPQLDRKVALKLLHLDPGAEISTAEAAMRLQREAQALARVSHPNTVAIFDVGTHDGNVFLAMEHLEGSTLRAWLKEKPQPWREVVKVCLEAGKGLAAVHAAGLVHRDFKPANVIITKGGAVKVLDFGLARLSPDSSQEREVVDGADLDFEIPSGALETPLTEAGSLSGTPGYMAPELMDGHAATTASDQFAFGVTLYIALYGVRPFSGTTFEEVRAALARGVPPPPEPSPAPRWLFEVVRRCLAQRPADRFESMTEVLAALAKDPARARRRWALRAATVLAVGLAAWVSFRVARVDCPTEEAFHSSLWSTDTRARLAATLLGAEPTAGPQVQRALQAIDERTAAWAHQSAQACLAAAGHQAARLDVQRSVCLKRRGEGMRILIEALGRGEPLVARHSEELVTRLLRNNGCVEEAELERLGVDEVTPAAASTAAGLRAGLLKARALGLSNRPEESMAEARAVLAQARDAGLVGFESEALQMSSSLVGRTTGHEEEAIAVMESSLQNALAAGTEGRAFFITEGLILEYIRTRKHLPEARLALKLMEALWVRLGRAEDMELSLIASRDRVAEAEGKADPFGDHAERAFQLAEKVYGPKSVEAAEAAMRLSVHLWDQGKISESNRLDEHALQVIEELKGPDEPSLAGYVSNLAEGLEQEGRSREARPLLEKALATSQRNHLEGDPATAAVETHLAELLVGTDDARAIELASHAIAVTEKMEDPELLLNALEARADALVSAGRPGEALTDCVRAQHRIAATPTVDAESRRDGWLCLAAVHASVKDFKTALAEFEKAAAAAPPSPLPTLRGRLAFGQAKALRATHGDEKKVVALAQEALAAWSAFPGFEAERAAVSGFLNEKPHQP